MGLPRRLIDDKFARHKQRYRDINSQRLVGKPGIANFDNLQWSPLEPLFGERGFDIVHMEHAKLVLGRQSLQIRNHRVKRFGTGQLET